MEKFLKKIAALKKQCGPSLETETNAFVNDLKEMVRNIDLSLEIDGKNAENLNNITQQRSIDRIQQMKDAKFAAEKKKGMLEDMPKLQSSVDIATMKLDKAKLDSDAEHQSAENAMQLVEEYCDKVIVYSGDVTLATHGLEEISNNKDTQEYNHNETVLDLVNQRKNEILRKVEIASFEVELHRKITYLDKGCPIDIFGDQGALKSSTSEKQSSSTRCSECGGVTTMENDIFVPSIIKKENGVLVNQLNYNNNDQSWHHGMNPGNTNGKVQRMYCSWKDVKCWEIDFLTGKCEPPLGLPSKCYRTNVLDPEVVKAIEAFQATRKGEMMDKKLKDQTKFDQIQHGGNGTQMDGATM